MKATKLKYSETAMQFANSVLPFIMRPPASNHLEEVRDCIAASIDSMLASKKEALQLQWSWIEFGKFTYRGLTYTKGINDQTAMTTLRMLHNLALPK